MKKVTKAVIPAAGLGTRVLPATKAMPKGMLPIVDKPAIQYIVEEAVRSGINSVAKGQIEAARALGKRDGGHLVADRLARRGGHDGEHVFACERGIHDALLVRAEALVAENLAEYVCRRANHDSRLHPPRGSREAGAA